MPKIDSTTLDRFHREIRMCVRNFLLIATRDQLLRELEIAREQGDKFREACIQELMDEEG